MADGTRSHALQVGKFAWMARVMEDKRLTETARLILTYCALQYVKGGTDTFSVRQQTVASHLHVHVNTVAGALRRAREFGWLWLIEERQRGRGWHKGDVHQLTLSAEEIPTPADGYYEEYPTREWRNTQHSATGVNRNTPSA